VQGSESARGALKNHESEKLAGKEREKVGEEDHGALQFTALHY
jgi:hypothetical protein